MTETETTAAKTDDGGPAFPLPFSAEGDTSWNRCGGMSLRDYFAAKAMQGLLLSDSRCRSTFDPKAEATYFEIAAGIGNTQAEVTAVRSYEMADAMLAARKGNK